MYSVEIQNLQYAYTHSEQKELLNIEHWQIKEGEQVFLYGPSGSGKSTLLNLLGGILLPRQGHIYLLNQLINQMNGRKRDQFRAQHIGMVFQQFNLIPYLNILDNILLAKHFSQKKNLDSNYLDELLASLKLEKDLLLRRADFLSIGQQQRVAIVRALINQPKILIVDEPTSALDSDMRDNFMSLLLKVIEQHKTTLIFVSHDKALQSYFSKVVDLCQLNQVEVF